jgi:adenine-specific DNA-methyltransferase
MLKTAVRNTKKLIREKAKAENVRIGRFFTKKSTAALLADMITPEKKEAVSILYPGAGTGILCAALLDRICAEGCTKSVELVCYENDVMMLPMLKNNLARMRKKCRRDYGVTLSFRIEEANFVLAAAELLTPTLFSAAEQRYDYVVMNPTSELLAKDSPEVLAIGNLAAGATDLAFLFAVLGMASLREGGQMAAVLPTAYAHAVHIEKIRRFLESEGHLSRMHIFAAKSKNAARPDEVRSHMLLSWVKAPLPEGATLAVSSSFAEDEKAAVTALPPFPYRRIVNAENGSLLLLKSEEEAEIIERVEALPESFASFGLKMRTGLTLENRHAGSLRSAPTDGAVPLICPKSIMVGTVRLPAEKYIVPTIPSLAQKNKNMLFIKRIPAKKDNRHLVCGVYLAAYLPRFAKISTHNKLNYVDYTDGREMDSPFLHGLYAVLSSDLYEKYCCILSKSAQINASEYGNLPLPDAKTLREIGSKLLMSRQLTPHICSVVVENALRPKRSSFM